MKGKIPLTAEMILESKEEQWRLLSNGLIKNLQTSAIIEINPEYKIRIKLTINNIRPPETLSASFRNQLITNMDKPTNNGINRILNFIQKKLIDDIWIFNGQIEGENKIPIVIIYFHSINTFIYSQKLLNETNEQFFLN